MGDDKSRKRIISKLKVSQFYVTSSELGGVTAIWQRVVEVKLITLFFESKR